MILLNSCSIIDVGAYPERKQNNFYYSIETEIHRNTKFSAPHFTSNQILILYKSYQYPSTANHVGQHV